MGLQPRIIACGTKMAVMTMAIKFLGGPLIMTGASVAVGLRGVKLYTAIVQVLGLINWWFFIVKLSVQIN